MPSREQPLAGLTLTAERPRPIRLHRLELRQFRNIEALTLELEAPRLLVIGRNGEGKSNLLEAVELLGSLRSHRTGSDRDLIQHGQSRALLRARTSAGDTLQLELRRQGGRQASRNGKVLERQQDLLGSLRCLAQRYTKSHPSLRRRSMAKGGRAQ
jgi:DNA replication and repair protein RecF